MGQQIAADFSRRRPPLCIILFKADLASLRPQVFIPMLRAAAVQVEVRHIGDMKFKGVTGVHAVMQINNVQFSGREFPAVPPNAKAELVRLPSGHSPSTHAKAFAACKLLSASN